MLSSREQIRNQIENSENILILTVPDASDDLVAAGWGLFHILKSIGKNPVVFESKEQKKGLDFLRVPEKIEKELVGARDFVLSFDTTRNKIVDFHTENKIDRFEIYITPEKETIDPRDFSFVPAKFKYDLMIVLGCPDLEKLGDLREKNSDLFFEVPLINIDNSSANENFGKVNLVDITASSVCEMLSGIFREYWEKNVSEDIAQCLLAGIISATSNFQSRNTTPQTFLAASWLIEKGADQQKIIRSLFKTQSFSFMKLWGRVMARLQWDEQLKFAWSTITLEDFVQSRTKPHDLPLVLEKVKGNFSSGKYFAILFSETLDRSIALIKNSDSESLKNIQKNMGGEIKNGHLEVIFEGKNILEAEKELLGKLRK